MLNKIAGVSKYALDKISAGGHKKLPITMNETEYFNTCEYGPTIYFFNISKMLTWCPSLNVCYILVNVQTLAPHLRLQLA